MTGLELEGLELGPVRQTLTAPETRRLPDGRLQVSRCKLGCDPQTYAHTDEVAVNGWVVHVEVDP